MPPRYIDLTKMVADAEREYLIEGERLKLAAFTQQIPRIHVTIPVCQFCDRGAGFHCNTGRTWCLACGREQA
jgi:hypothetical protein